MSKSISFTRRHFLKLSGTAGATAMLAACAPGGAPEAASSAEGASADMAQTATQSIPELLGADMPGSPAAAGRQLQTTHTLAATRGCRTGGVAGAGPPPKGTREGACARPPRREQRGVRREKTSLA